MIEDDELAEDEEEILVYVEFDGSVPGNTFSNEKLHLDMIGLDKEHPIMQVNGKFYEGTYQDAVGTYMFLEKDKNPIVDDPVFDKIPSLKYYAKTRKVLRMNRIFVEPKNDMLGDSNEAEFIPNMESIRKAGVPPRYQDAALKSWEMMRNNRMDALNRYLEKERIRSEKRSQGIEPDSESDYDNPFSIYKPDRSERKSKKNESNVSYEHAFSSDNEEAKDSSRDDEDIDQDLQASTIADPGPSTSKDSKPWSSPPSAEEQNADSDFDEIDHMKVSDDNRTNVKADKKVKLLKKSMTKLNKKDKRTSKSKQSRNSDSEETNEIDVAQSERLLSKDLNSLLESFGNANTKMGADRSTKSSESTTEGVRDTSDEVGSIIAKMKLEKQQKRKEKMRLVSQRFKKAAEETKLKAQKSPGSGI